MDLRGNHIEYETLKGLLVQMTKDKDQPKLSKIKILYLSLNNENFRKDSTDFFKVLDKIRLEIDKIELDLRELKTETYYECEQIQIINK